MKRIRTLTSVPFWVLALCPSIGLGLSMGDIRLYSHLNEPLDAEIAITDTKGIEVADLKPSISNAEVYAKAGYEPMHWLELVQFEVVTDPQTQLTVVKLTTQEPIKDPVADLLVEIASPQGRLAREYTLLIDPPKSVMSNASVRQAVQGEAGMRRLSGSNSQATFGGRYGPVYNETLWSIAKKLVANSSFSVYQGVEAIAEKNPQAFKGGNIHRMVEGATLNLPTEVEMQRYTSQDSRQYVSQGQTAKQASANNAIMANQQPLPPETNPALEDTVKALTQPATQPNNATPATAPQDAQQKALTLVGQGEPSNGQVSALPDAQVTQRLSMIEEALDTLQRSNEDMSAKNTQLQSQNESLNQVLAMKEEEIRQLKSSLGTNEQQYAVATTENLNASSPISMTQAVAPEKVTPAPTDAKPTQAKPEKPIPPVEQVAHDRQNSAHLQIFLLIFSFVVAAGVFVIAWFARDILQDKWHLLRKIPVKQWFTRQTFSQLRQPSYHPIEESDLPWDEPGPKFDLDKALSAVQREEKKQAIEPAKDQEAVPEKNRDIMAEVDNYIAYEKYGVAERTLKDIIALYPNEDEARLKLLELYVLTEKFHEFESVYNDLPPALQERSPEIWAKIHALHRKVENERSVHLDPAKLFKEDEDGEQKLSLARHTLPKMELPNFDLKAKDVVQATTTASVTLPSAGTTQELVDLPMPIVSEQISEETTELEPEPAPIPTPSDAKGSHRFGRSVPTPQEGFLDMNKKYSLQLEQPTPDKPKVKDEYAQLDPDAKVTLAKAYIKVGKYDCARDLLVPLLAESDDGRKQMIQSILDGIHPKWLDGMHSD